MKQEKLNQFFVIYEEELARAVEKNKEELKLTPEQVAKLTEDDKPEGGE